MTVDQMTDILDIKPLIPPSLWPFLITLLLLILFTGLFIYWLKKRKQNKLKPKAPKIERRESPREKALKALESLLASGLLEHHQYRKFYFAISEILRTFLQEEYGIEAVDATTEELKPRIQNFPTFTEEQKKEIQDLLTEMDLVKFAKMNPSTESLNKIKNGLRQLIEQPLLSPPLESRGGGEGF